MIRNLVWFMISAILYLHMQVLLQRLGPTQPLVDSSHLLREVNCLFCTAQEGVSSQYVQILGIESGYVALKPNILDMCN